MRPSGQGLNVPQTRLPHSPRGFSRACGGDVCGNIEASDQALNVSQTRPPLCPRGKLAHAEAMLRPSGQGLNIPPTFFPDIVLGLWGHVEALPTLGIIILNGCACGPQHAPPRLPRGRPRRTRPAATRQYYSPAILPKSDPPRGGGHASVLMPLSQSRTP